MVGGTDHEYTNPVKFKDAWHHEDVHERGLWREAMRKEIRDMKKKQVWRRVKRNSIPRDRRVIGNKWVFKRKGNGVYRARLVALGYSQVPGVDHEDNFSPVVVDITYRIIVIMSMVWKLQCEIVDVETAFLYGELDEEIYMKMPIGIAEILEEAEDDDECVVLDKALYGLVQAARQFFKKLTHVMEDKLGFVRCKADNCLLMRENKLGLIVVCVYIDDTLCVGSKESLKKFKTEISEHFAVKEEGIMTEFVGCSVVREKESLYMHQWELIRRMESSFEEEVKTSGRLHDTPGIPGVGITKLPEGEERLDSTMQTKFRSGVGMLLFLVKYSRPDIANSVRELSKVNDCAGKKHFGELLRCLKYVFRTRNRVLMFSPTISAQDNFEWSFEGYCDSDFAGDKDKRISVTGFCIYICGCLVSWKSRGQKHITLSSTEAEYVAVSEICQEIMFIRSILEFLGVKFKTPITVYCNNVGAIFLAYNAKTGGRTKHIDVKYHYVREYVRDGIVQIVFVRSENNHSDVFTKNTAHRIYEEQTGNFMETTG